jgi:protocatechuate 3,4-dioxygenase beta subunit
MSNVVDVYCRFPSFEVALAVGRALRMAEDPSLTEDYVLEDLQPDGQYGNNRYDIVKVGTVYDSNGQPVPGYHIIGRFRGPDPVPEQLAPFIVPAWNQVLG